MKFSIKVACLVTFMAQTHMANAENWVKVTVNPLVAAYIDADVATRDGDVVKFSELTDLKMAETINGRLILSRKSLVEHDCKKLTRRVLALSTFQSKWLLAIRFMRVRCRGTGRRFLWAALAMRYLITFA